MNKTQEKKQTNKNASSHITTQRTNSIRKQKLELSQNYLLAANSIQYRCDVNQLNPCHAELIKMPHPLLIFSQSDCFIPGMDINSHTLWQTVQVKISWLLQKPTDLVLHCLQRQSISRFSRTWVNFQNVLDFVLWNYMFILHISMAWRLPIPVPIS